MVLVQTYVMLHGSSAANALDLSTPYDFAHFAATVLHSSVCTATPVAKSTSFGFAHWWCFALHALRRAAYVAEQTNYLTKKGEKPRSAAKS